MNQSQLFGPGNAQPTKPADRGIRSLRVVITVKAAPTPSATYGETVCVAGISADLARPGWLRLYPINFRYLQQDVRFSKYDIVSVEATPASQDQRAESFRPHMSSLVVERHLKPWRPRRQWIDPYIEDSMCALNGAARANPHSKSLALVRPVDVRGFKIEPHPGWTPDEKRRIDAYVSQLDLFDDDDRAPLEAPRFRGSYQWRCGELTCRGHEQGVLDWEFVALQRHLRGRTDSEAIAALRTRFLDELCASHRDVAFFVGNQAKRAHVFSVLGVYYPKKSD